MTTTSRLDALRRVGLFVDAPDDFDIERGAAGKKKERFVRSPSYV